MVVNKYDLEWQVTRVKAKFLKTVEHKLEYVGLFIKDNNTADNRARVLNWANMLRMAYKEGRQERVEIDEFIETVQKSGQSKTFSDYSVGTLKVLLHDLEARKWDFQYNKAPKDHIEFVIKLKEYLYGKEA